MYKEKVMKIDIYSSIYPLSLKEIYDPPKVLYLKGNLELLKECEKNISIVGSRKVSEKGKRITREFTKYFVENEYVIVSGLALGIDSLCHEVALENKGKVIAVLPSSVENIYPKSSISLSEKILNNGGLLISEYEEGFSLTKQNFYFRNRIITGLSTKLFIPECEIDSGSMISAKLAFEQDREIYTVPRDIYEEKGKGNNYLIQRDMARLATDPKSILQF
jgi:DNA processing protein